MRLDKFVSGAAAFSRKDASLAVKKGRIAVNGAAVRDPSARIDPEKDEVLLDGERLFYSEFVYVMLNKPEGVVSSTEDGDVTVIDLLPEKLRRIGLFPCGRLDKNTLGFVLLTNNGKLAHFLLSPVSHVEKIYRFKSEKPLSSDDVETLEKGVDIGGYVTKPCSVFLTGDRLGNIRISEGKYHQIKLMFRAIGNSITELERISFAGIPLDPLLPRGQWRYLNEDEISILEKNYR